MENPEGFYSKNKNDILSHIQICLAGMVAERLIFGLFSNGNTSDLRAARDILYVFYFGSGASKSLG